MAHWDSEQFQTQEPPKDTLCATCEYRLKPITIGTYTQNRSNYSSCDMYSSKPVDINWGRVPCPLYKKEHNDGS